MFDKISPFKRFTKLFIKSIIKFMQTSRVFLSGETFLLTARMSFQNEQLNAR